MKHRSSFLIISVCGLMIAAAATSRGQSISPEHIEVVAGDTGVFTISGLPTDTDYAPAQIYMTSFDPDRVAIVGASPLSQLTYEVEEQQIDPDTGETNIVVTIEYLPALQVHVAARHRMEGLFEPIPVSGYIIRQKLQDDTLEFLGYVEAEVSVLDPMLMFHPDTLAVQTPNVRPVVLQRSIHAFASLTVTLRSDVEHVLGLGATTDPGTHTDRLELTFDPFDINKVFYISGRSMAEDADSITGTLSAQVGSYLHDRAITVTRHPSVILQPVPYSGLGTNRTATLQAGDAFNLLVRRTSDDDKLVSDYEVTLVSDRPSVAGVPESVTIPAGAVSAAFTVSGRKPGETVIRATGPNAETVAESAFGVVVVEPLLDYAPAVLRMDEGETALLTITRPNTFSGGDLTIDISSQAPSLFRPAVAQLLMPAGSVSVAVEVDALAPGSNHLAVAVGSYRFHVPVNVLAVPSGVVVDLSPPEVVAAGARWRIEGGEWLEHGEFAPVDPGRHLVEFLDIGGWLTPPVREVSVFPEQTTFMSASYSEDAESGLLVYLMPFEAVAAGARWRIEGGEWLNDGDFLRLDPGDYRVEFSEVEGWLTPSWLNADVGPDVATVVTASYHDSDVDHGLAVYIYPPEAVAAGAAWRISDSGWQGSGSLLELEEGDDNIVIEFRQAEDWLHPGPITVGEVADGVAVFERNYHRGEVIGRGYGESPGYFHRPTGLAFDSQGRLLVADSRNHRLQRLEADGNWTVIGGPGSGAGEFNEPVAVVAGDHDVLYVSEIGNHRIQYRAGDGSWQFWGGPDYGAATGEFNGPFDLALDSEGNLYVADLYNNRVQLRTAADGEWSQYLAPGAGYDTVWMPSGVAVWDNQLALSDHVSPEGLSRVLLFDDPPAEGGLIGSSRPAEGGLGRLYGLSAGPGDRLLAADSTGNRVVFYSRTGEKWRILADDILNDPRSALWRSDGGVDYCYIADAGNHRVLRVIIPPGNPAPPVAGAIIPEHTEPRLQIKRGMTETADTSPGDTTAAVPKGEFIIRWQGRSDMRYTLQYAGQPCDSSGWQSVPGAALLPGRDGLMEYHVTRGTTPAFFFRIVAYPIQ